MLYLTNQSTDPHWNMAFDEFILEQFPLDEPVFYLWQNRPSVIIGFNQNAFAEVNLDYLAQKNIVLARRVTGGGAVYHDLNNLNYTIVGRSRDLDRDYPEYLHFVVNALRQMGVDAEQSGRNDILVDGRKCSGYAKRVWKDRLMVHGTLMFDVDLTELTAALAVPGSKLSAAGVASVRSRVANLKDYLPQFTTIQAFQSALQQILSAGDGLLSLTQEQLGAISREADTKFRTWEWNYGRSPRADFSSRRKFGCGTVEASWSIVHGCIADLHFAGDFLGNLSPDGLIERLNGCRYDRTKLLERLSQTDPSLYFDRLSSDDLLSLFF
jgi:lipoate-protein ligase A